MDESKAWYASKEIWTAIVALACGVLLIFGVQVDAAAQSSLSTSLLGAVVSVASVLKIIFRIFSSRKKLTATSSKATS